MAVVPSWLVVTNRAVGDDARLRVDVRVRRTRVPELLVRMLQWNAQWRAIVTSETGHERRHA